MSRSKHARSTHAAIAFRKEEGQRKSKAVEAAVLALQFRLRETGETFGVQDVADRAKVSRAFIYAHPELRAQIAPLLSNDDFEDTSPLRNVKSAPPHSAVATTDSVVENAASPDMNTATVTSLVKRIKALESTVASLAEKIGAINAERIEWRGERDALYARLARLTDGK
ncbi:hypothetical protein [Paraburkholderia bannensis]|uniref:hypothetical protein n=1 Tax=Paraburkholderia bannensis TaxID=765414 RepID=UPI002AAF16EE|nr:hypothetical protein [Paraburkholderia bannensis]